MHFVFSKNKTKIATGILPRGLCSPFRSIKGKRSLNGTGLNGLYLKTGNLSQLRSRISPVRAFVSDIQPFRNEFSRNESLNDLKEPSCGTVNREDAGNVIRTPSTVKENEPLMDDSIDESLFSYFNNEYNVQNVRTPIPKLITPSIRHRYQISAPSDMVPYRSDTPKIPTRDKAKEEVKLPVVETKHKPREIRTNRSPSPQDQPKRQRIRQDYFSRPKNQTFAYKQKIRIQS